VEPGVQAREKGKKLLKEKPKKESLRDHVIALRAALEESRAVEEGKVRDGWKMVFGTLRKLKDRWVLKKKAKKLVRAQKRLAGRAYAHHDTWKRGMGAQHQKAASQLARAADRAKAKAQAVLRKVHGKDPEVAPNWGLTF